MIMQTAARAAPEPAHAGASASSGGGARLASTAGAGGSAMWRMSLEVGRWMNAGTMWLGAVVAWGAPGVASGARSRAGGTVWADHARRRSATNDPAGGLSPTLDRMPSPQQKSTQEAEAALSQGDAQVDCYDASIEVERIRDACTPDTPELETVRALSRRRVGNGGLSSCAALQTCAVLLLLTLDHSRARPLLHTLNKPSPPLTKKQNSWSTRWRPPRRRAAAPTTSGPSAASCARATATWSSCGAATHRPSSKRASCAACRTRSWSSGGSTVTKVGAGSLVV
jgi:hypothetical protein